MDEPEKLARELKYYTDGNDPFVCLDAAAREWATFSLKTFRGKALKRALKISVAIAEFTATINEAKLGTSAS